MIWTALTTIRYQLASDITSRITATPIETGPPLTMKARLSNSYPFCIVANFLYRFIALIYRSRYEFCSENLIGTNT